MKSKIEQFITRTEKRNKHLYEDDKIENKDYVLCPVTNVRLYMIKKNYVEKTLGINWDEYLMMYPTVNLICEQRIINIKNGLKKILPNGLTAHQFGIEKSKITWVATDDNGLTSHEKRGIKTKNTHLTKIDENGLNGYQRLSKYRQDTIIDGLTVDQISHSKRIETITKRGYSRKSNYAASKISKKVFKDLIDKLILLNINYYFDTKEYAVRSKEFNKFFMYDLVIPDFKICLEYQSQIFHPNPEWDDKKWNLWTDLYKKYKSPEEKLKYDYMKAKCLYDDRNIITFFIWEGVENFDMQLVYNYLGEVYDFEIK